MLTKSKNKHLDLVSYCYEGSLNTQLTSVSFCSCDISGYK